MEDTIDELNAIKIMLNIAQEHNLTNEVILYAIKHMKQNNSLNISEVINLSINEWIR